ncbi:glycerol-3-phosphate responsive antiterminator [Alkalicoccus luteus]|uniref:Glycerol uptake operon antiterminator regulatory protein n=1 Tax=Alkalicoccus luteus TaxID=1237094 RepID=A0A969PRY4_9BACI|nr:glycerol-3-phosphate responsive antiterminator [Alkalicoccus luteus]NJP38430.1 glycerol-3-phosphate responsive antiterminator [Alkalicoccus luteus]
MLFENQRVTPSVSGAGEFMKAALEGAEAIVLAQSSMEELVKVHKICRRRPGMKLLLHLDSMKGLSKTPEAVSFLAGYIKPDALITSSPQAAVEARRHGITSVLRCFAFDEESIDSSLKLIERANPDYVQVVPGVIPVTIRLMRAKTGLPVLAGGLVRTDADVCRAEKAGATGITSSCPDLWQAAYVSRAKRS